MNQARRKAIEVRGRYGDCLQDILDGESIQVMDFALKGRLKEVIYEDIIVIKKDLSDSEKRELVAHALGHYFLHAGNQYSISLGSHPWDKFQERQAEVFAAYLLIPKAEGLDTREVAKTYSVTEKFAEFRLKLFGAFKE